MGMGQWSVVVGSAIFAVTSLGTTGITGLSNGVNTLRWTISNGKAAGTMKLLFRKILNRRHT